MWRKASFLKEQIFTFLRSLHAHNSPLTMDAFGQEHVEVNSADDTDKNDRIKQLHSDAHGNGH